ncbi:hypothetical protein LOTGIDRAFT_178787 [Lottia gigantea]|uniref:G-protein coupled receptors family 1 profile domain-containing protein n=1 Tax=Lottia gigantea TaxID=225164 RepID=V4A2Q6_LOTGI|nr:hypothetical protein LOTGIDRAFT_178787 [Lottia gigantea]ESO90972.1 hypothetical protein LOTGIDRAFT_178787 [Lottia gigantea]
MSEYFTNNEVDAGFVISTICLTLLVAVVIAGNILVIAAVLTTRKLRTVTNIFIVNLACADLLLGIFVLPFSAALEVLDSWIFGTIWCHVWLATDVLLCTASIFNLCCISLDRYIAITRPMKYPGLMSSKRGKLLVAATWIVSFLISLPPLIGWNDGNDETSQQTTSQPCEFIPVKCELINTRGYRIYSALGSYFIPMFIMVFFYIRIYRAAVKTISAYQKGVLTTKSNGVTVNNKVTLRVHRGGSYINHNTSNRSNKDSVERRKSAEKQQLSSTNGINPSRDKNQKGRKGSDRLKPTNGVRIKFSGNGPTRTSSALQKTGKNMKTQMRKFNREQKAAKTLAIIVGAFILCWLPFFSIYLIGAFCDDCIPAVLFSVLFWLGYCNSAINPCVYALFAKDFRFAFKKLLTCGIRRLPSKSGSDLAAMNLNPLQSINNFSENSSES